MNGSVKRSRKESCHEDLYWRSGEWDAFPREQACGCAATPTHPGKWWDFTSLRRCFVRKESMDPPGRTTLHNTLINVLTERAVTVFMCTFRLCFYALSSCSCARILTCLRKPTFFRPYWDSCVGKNTHPGGKKRSLLLLEGVELQSLLWMKVCSLFTLYLCVYS